MTKDEELKNSNQEINNSNDYIGRQAAIKGLTGYIDDTGIFNQDQWFVHGIKTAITHLKSLPSVQPEVAKDTNVPNNDCISRQAVIDVLAAMQGRCTSKAALIQNSKIWQQIKDLPSVQPEPLSDAYMKAVWTWLLNYQIKVAELQGRYTPYEVLSWVANDWRKEHDGSD